MTGADPQPMQSRDRRPWASAVVIAAACLVAYHNSFGVPFFFDDRAQINDNPTIRHLWPLSTVLSPPADAGVGGRPLLNLSFAVNYALGGMNPWGYHALNLAIHLCAALALFGILRRMLSLPASSDPIQVSAFDAAQARGLSLRRGSGQGSQPSISASRFPLPSSRFEFPAFLISLLWAVQPVQTESVTYVAERAEEQMGLFYLLTVYCFIRYAEQSVDRIQVSAFDTAQARGFRSQPSISASRFPLPAAGNSGFRFQVSAFLISPPWPCLSVLACLLGVLTKEVAVTAPVVVLLLDRTFVSGGFRAALRRHRGVYAGFAAAWAALACDMVLTDVHRRGVGLGLGGSWWNYALTESRALTGYLGLAVWPHPLIFDRGMGVGRPGWEVAPFVLLVLGLVGACAWALLRPVPRDEGGMPAPGAAQRAGFAGAWFFLILAPTSSVVAVAGQPMADHRLYLPVAAVLAVLVAVAAAAGERWIGARFRRAVLAAVAAVAVASAIAGTIHRNGDYRTELAIWDDTVAKCPANERALNGLGLALAAQGQWQSAIARYEAALRVDPDYADAHQNLGVALREVGRVPEAVEEFRKAVTLKPGNVAARADLGIALELAGRSGEAVGILEEGLRLHPGDPGAENSLGLALVDLRRPADAVRHFGEAVRLAPDRPEYRQNLGSALFETGRLPEAIEQMRAVVRLQPSSPEAHYDLSLMLRESGKNDEARAELEEALRLGLKR